MNESDYIWSLISSKIESFKVSVFEELKDFYDHFDNTKSLNRQSVLDLITNVNLGLDSILKEKRK